MINDTISAISTGNITATAISIVRLSGENCFEVLNKIFKCKTSQYQGNHIYYGHIVDPANHNQPVDEVLVSIFKAPHSFTGENMAEINCHGGVFITRKILMLTLANGARQALNGEFSQRAFLNGKIDLTQAEAINDLIYADNNDNAQLAMNSLSGTVKKMLEPLIDNVAQIMAHIEVNIDYPEYDDNGVITAEEIQPIVEQWLTKCDEILTMANSSMIIKEGINTVIVGKPNVGKSSLLNALLQQDKAIISSQAGTTRDLVEGDVHLKNVTLHLVDTAGIHHTSDVIEQLGIDRSIKALKKAQLVIVVLDGSQPLDQQDEDILEDTKNSNRIIVYNKSDLSKEKHEVNICAQQDDIKELTDKINQLFEEDRIALSQPVLTNERQISLMMQAKEAMQNVREGLQMAIPLDLLQEDIQKTYRCLKEILGEYNRENLLDEIFSRFCVGK